MSTKTTTLSQKCAQKHHKECDGWSFPQGRQSECSCSCHKGWNARGRREGLERNRRLLWGYLTDPELTFAEGYECYRNDPDLYIDPMWPTDGAEEIKHRLGYAGPEDDVADPWTYSEGDIWPRPGRGVV